MVKLNATFLRQMRHVGLVKLNPGVSLFVGRPRLQMFSCHNDVRLVLRNMPTKIYFIKNVSLSKLRECDKLAFSLSLSPSQAEVLKEREKCFFFRFLFTPTRQETVPFLYLILKLALGLKLCRHTTNSKTLCTDGFLILSFSFSCC